MKCKKCGYEGDDFYVSNKSRCKECVKAAVRKNRSDNVDYYRKYDAERFKNDPRVAARHHRYQKTEAGKKAHKKAHKKWKSMNPIKRGANMMVCNAVRDGRMIKADECSECGAGGKIHGHHDDYAKPLEVRWMCSKCHTDWHKINGNGKNG